MQTMGRKPKPTTAFGKRLVALREKLGLTQAEAAEKVCVSRGTWIAWETGVQEPSRSHLKLIEFLKDGKL